ncbi:uncharacterized protein [Physcomitrium patens]|uniref:BTB domain-containing protein n=1 Tax=Physcomitrium patens TaxID=3218 RepID=A0A7I4A4B6_PHYPA|nr:uncharacterized protein LOC112287849 isoform X1 [Physcomitrium patens]XP_024387144.1 uncharacterized protein LOC112287849 isoform X1 [Physcomitrium patens]XP_024387145.1 uncharacterized protein LOC112287849 isoform X1 [Physcomitrium patens]XP_024387146.1 uncharacterized protein LOC112287849 isoform X1 [Physcomitrium patens]XP_024387148.1 uncharacterized protein LOC112287849 isoform X1 [Physcomitrium patens]XP_024387149.1 uncharacterized protein LOC112287849 isoform X1 [Physcomitrium patens]|eukprot:XP_024387143.1 uncharacterized protein LOC112287849 isoform X1 [Physcomitrella patens]
MADSMGELTINGGTSFSLSNSGPLPLDVTAEALHVRPPPFDPLVHPHSLTLAHELVSNGEESEHNDAAMEAVVDMNSQGPGNLDDDDVPSDGEESDGNDLIGDGKAESFEQNANAVSGEDSQNALRDERRSKRAESWARARFDAWRGVNKKPTTESIEDLCDRDMKELGELVGLFLTQVRKQNGKEYPPETIGSLLRALGRVIRAHQEVRIAETQVPEVPFNIMSDVRFKKARQAVSDNVASAGRLGLGKRRKRIDVLTLHDEAAMLALSTYKATTAKGCSMRFAYFCTRNFFIRGPAELHELTDMDFSLGKDHHGEFLRYEKRPKSWSSDSPQSQPEKFSRPVTCYIEDVVSTYKIMVEHKPKWAEDEPPPRPFFLTDIKNPTSRTVWYTRSPVGVRTLASWLRMMTKETGLGGEYYTNKTGRTTGLGRLQYAGVPIDQDMLATGPRVAGTYARDDPEFEGIRERAMQRIVSGEVDKSTGRLIDWSKALALEMELSKKPQSAGTGIQTMAIQSYSRDLCANLCCQDVGSEGSELTMYKEYIGCDTCKQDTHSKDAYEQYRGLVEELEKTKERLVHLERRLQGKEFDGTGDLDHIPPPYSDVVFESLDGRKVYGHRAVLASQSDVFKAMFSMPMAEGTPLHMEMNYPALDAFIFFFYRATVNQAVLRNHLVELLQAADKYGIEALKSLCEQEILQSLNPTKVLVTYVVGWRHNSDVVKEGVIDYAAKEVDDVSALEGYDTFSKKCPEAVMELYDGVVKRLKRKHPRQEPLSTLQDETCTADDTESEHSVKRLKSLQGNEPCAYVDKDMDTRERASPLVEPTGDW